MSYEYGTGQQGLNYPNPYKFENIFLLLRVGLFTIVSLVLFIYAKLDLEKQDFLGLIINLGLASLFIYFIIRTIFILSKQYRVYFGRGQPKGLAEEKTPDMEGTSESANRLKEVIRQGAITVDSPHSPIYGFLYSYYKNLIIAPKEIRAIAEHLYTNIIKLSIISFLFLLSSFFTMGHDSGGWLGLFFFGITLTIILKPLIRNNFSDIKMNITTFWKLFAFSLIIPIVLILFGNSVPNISNFNFGIQSFLIIIMTIIGDLFILHSLRSHLFEPNAITTAFEQDTVTFNAPPSQINFEIERRLQQEWKAAIPNRIYSKISSPLSNGASGLFRGQIIQETQPMIPDALLEEQSLHTIKASPRLFKTFLIEIFSFIFTLIACIGIVSLAIEFHLSVNKSFTMTVWIPLFLGMLSLSSYWIKIAHALWGRFDFSSKLYVFEWEGNFVKAKTNFGNKFKDTLQTQKDIINIESMTLRVWVTHLNTTVFGHGISTEVNNRSIISMVGLKEESQNWVNHIKSFAQSQSMLLNPTSSEDINRAVSLSQINNLASAISTNTSLSNDAVQKIIDQNKNQ